jgi:hypothetical protein
MGLHKKAGKNIYNCMTMSENVGLYKKIDKNVERT